MLLNLLLANLLLTIVLCSETNGSKPCVFPVPFNLPNRNDRSDQCWIRIEDVEIVETVTVYCYIAHAFLRSYIRDYNTRKMTEDDVDVSLWSEPKIPDEQIGNLPPKLSDSNNGHKAMKDWKMTTIMDSTTHMRLYVSLQADCRLVMYSREGMTNYKVDCDRLLYFVNDHLSGSAKRNVPNLLIATVCIFLVFILKLF